MTAHTTIPSLFRGENRNIASAETLESLRFPLQNAAGRTTRRRSPRGRVFSATS